MSITANEAVRKLMKVITYLETKLKASEEREAQLHLDNARLRRENSLSQKDSEKPRKELTFTQFVKEVVAPASPEESGPTGCDSTKAQPAVAEPDNSDFLGQKCQAMEERSSLRPKAEAQGTELPEPDFLEQKRQVTEVAHSNYSAALGPGAERQACRVYVANLAFKVTSKELEDHFNQAGEVVQADVMCKGSVKGGRSKGFGIVEFRTPQEAERAKGLTDTQILGRRILVREDRQSCGPRQMSELASSGGVWKGKLGKMGPRTMDERLKKGGQRDGRFKEKIGKMGPRTVASK